MSGFLCNDFHISVLAQYASKQLPRYQQLQPEAIGAILYAENVCSIDARYQQNTPITGFQFDERARFKTCSLRQIIKIARRLDAQFRKHEVWVTSEAKTIINEIIIDASQTLQWEMQR